jgi:ABC-type lipoprotein export system ATPase subunit
VIRLRHIYKTYGQRHVLRDVSLDLPAGEVSYLLGPSGSGKTTLLQIISGHLLPTSGQVHYENESLWSRLSFWQKHMGFIYQDFRLLSHLTVYENIALPLSLESLSRQQAHKRLLEVVEGLGLSQYLQAYPQELSGGQKQRVAIARALVREPRYLFADEPTGNLDTENAKQVFSLLHEVTKKKGSSVVIVTHDLALVEQFPGAFCYRMSPKGIEHEMASVA